MIRRLLLPALVLLCLCAGSASAQTACIAIVKPLSSEQGTTAAAPAWVRYANVCDEFAVELPGEPFVHETARSVKGKSYEVTERARVYGLYSEGVIYKIASFDNPRADESLDYFIEQFGARALFVIPARFTKNVTSGTARGRQFDSTGGAPRRGVVRFYLTPHHAYMVAADGGDESVPAVKRFLDSFDPQGAPGATRGPSVHTDSPSPSAQVNETPPTVVPPTPHPVPSGRSRPSNGEGGGSGPEAAPGSNTGVGSPVPGSGPVDDNAPFRASEVTQKAIIVYKPEPSYTEQARRDNVAGAVRLRAVLGADGKVLNISVVKGLSDGLNEKAINAARHLLFFPAQKDGRRVSQWVTLEYNFLLF